MYYPHKLHAGDNWYNRDWKYRKTITINASKVSGGADLSNFPVLISTTDASFKHTSVGGSVASSNGYDFLFTSDNGTTKLAHEIESYTSSTGQLIAWIKIPTLSAATNTRIYLYYGNPYAGNQQDVANVWDANFVNVQHLNDLTTSTTTDSTANSKNGTKKAANEPQVSSSGYIGNGQLFDGSNDYITADKGSFNTYIGTVSVWVNNTAAWNTVTNIQTPFVTGQDGNGDLIDLEVTNTQDIRILFWDGYAANLRIATVVNQPTANTWHHLAVTWNGALDANSNAQIYLDGTALSMSADQTISTDAIGSNINFGGNSPINDRKTWSGSIDEMKVSATARSAGWIVTEYNNQSSPATFYSVSDTESIQETGVVNLPQPNRIPGWKYEISAGPHFVGKSYVLSSTAAPGFFLMIPSTTHHDDLYIPISSPSWDKLPTKTGVRVPFPWEQGLNTVSQAFYAPAFSAFNGYSIPKTDNPFIIAMVYDLGLVTDRTISTLKIARFDETLHKWKIIPSPQIINYQSHFIATTTHAFGLFALVYPR
jgi:hypothetical protein